MRAGWCRCLLNMDDTTPNTIVYETLTELLSLVSPRIDMWSEPYYFDSSVNLLIRFKEEDKFPIYHRWLEEVLATFKGHIQWGLFHVVPGGPVYYEKLLLWPMLFVEYWRKYGPSSDEDMRAFFGSENYKWINLEAMKDAEALAAHIRSRYHSHPPA